MLTGSVVVTTFLLLNLVSSFASFSVTLSFPNIETFSPKFLCTTSPLFAPKSSPALDNVLRSSKFATVFNFLSSSVVVIKAFTTSLSSDLFASVLISAAFNPLATLPKLCGVPISLGFELGATRLVLISSALTSVSVALPFSSNK